MGPCGHKLHLSCLRPLMLSALPGQRNCPTCRLPLLNGELGVPVPLAAPDPMAGMLGHMNIATNQAFVEVGNQMMVIGEQKERVLFPMYLEAVRVPVLVGLTQFRPEGELPFEGLDCIRWNLFFGKVPQHRATDMIWKKVGLIPGLTAELRLFWLHRDRTYDNFCLSVLRCRELMRKVSASAEFLEYNMQYAPIAALYRSQGAMEVAMLVQPNVVKSWGFNWDLIWFVIISIFIIGFVLYGYGAWDDIWKELTNPGSYRNGLMDRIAILEHLNTLDADLE